MCDLDRAEETAPAAGRKAMISRRQFAGGAGLALLGSLFPAIGVQAAPSVNLHGEAHLGLKGIGGALGMTHAWMKKPKSAVLTSQWTRMEFEQNKRGFSLNGIRVYLGRPVTTHRDDLYIAQRDYERTVQPILTPHVFSGVPKLYHIVIDPGHGGNDPGTQNTKLKYQEKVFALDVSKRLQKILTGRGYKITLTRETDKYVSLEERAAMANRVKADLFLSVHFNAASPTSVKGAETYALTPRYQPSTNVAGTTASNARFYAGNRNDVWNTLVGYYIQRELVKDLDVVDRGLRRARWGVLKSLNCPGVLIEGGFLSNTTEAKSIGDAGYRQRIALSITDAVITYQRTLNRLRGR